MSRLALVVEDSPTMRELVVVALRRVPEFDVDEAEDGLAALRKMAKRTYDIILTDLNMPSLDGLKLIAFARRDERHHQTPIIVITTERAAEDRRRAFALGASAYLYKPIRGAEIVAKVEELLGLPA